LHQDGRGLYGIGAYGFQLAHVDADKDHARSLALATLPDLVKLTNETVFLSEWGQTAPRILQVVDAAKPISIRPTMQGEIPILLSATGRVFAAFMDVSRMTALIDAEIDRFRREQTLSSRDLKRRRQAFLKQLPDVRRRCLARTTGERYPGLISFAAPIFDPRGQAILALTSFGLAATFPSAWDAPVPRALLNSATELTQRIGGRRP
jgi:DNA-binding IclR family transcriptional regulator